MIMHIDMDAFFVSVEEADDPALIGKCVVVGGDSKRSIVAAAGYEARKFGIGSAMPIYMAKKACPGLIVIPPRKKRYAELSNSIMELLRNFSPLVEQASIDEAYLDISGTEKLFGDPIALGERIKKEIKQKVNLSCSVGIAPNKFLAKIASDIRKPDGLTYIAPESALLFARELPIENVPGVGKKTMGYFKMTGVKTLGDILKISDTVLISKLGKIAARLKDMANCIDNSPVIPDIVHKSVSSESTFDENTFDKKILASHLLRQSWQVAKELRRHGLSGKSVTIKMKFSDFTQITRSFSFAFPVSSGNTIFKKAKELLDSYKIVKSVRLVGVNVSSITGKKAYSQKKFFGESDCTKKKWECAEKTIDIICDEFGKEAVVPASLLKVKQHGQG